MITAIMMKDEVNEPPQGWGSFEDADALRRWSFLQRTPQHAADAVQEPTGGQSAADRART
jgi:hypothetical protein